MRYIFNIPYAGAHKKELRRTSIFFSSTENKTLARIFIFCPFAVDFQFKLWGLRF